MFPITSFLFKYRKREEKRKNNDPCKLMMDDIIFGHEMLQVQNIKTRNYSFAFYFILPQGTVI